MRSIAFKILGTDPQIMREQHQRKEITDADLMQGLRTPYIDYKQMIKQAISESQDPQRGLSVSDIRTAVKIIDKIDAAEEQLLLEEAEYQFVKSKVAAMSFIVAHKNIVEFVDDIENAPEVDTGEDNIRKLPGVSRKAPPKGG